MTTKQQIQREVNSIDEQYLDELHEWIERFLESKPRARKQSLMSQLKAVKIQGPSDFSTELDLYASGEKSVGQNIR